MTQKPPVLDYGTPPPKHRVASLITPRNIAHAVWALTLVSLAIPLDLGSGRFILNPFRVLGCVLVVACAMLYALLRLWGEPAAGLAQRLVFSLCLFLSVGCFAEAHFSVWGRTRLPPRELHYAYWRWLLAGAVVVSITCLFSLVSEICRRWVRPASPNGKRIPIDKPSPDQVSTP